MRPLIAYLSESALLHNLAQIKRFVGDRKICAVVKANAYGHSIERIAPILGNKVDYFAVASIEEALVIRKLLITTPIILLEGVFSSLEYDICASNNFVPSIQNARQLEWLESANLIKHIDVFLKIDTGMHRLGFAPQNFMECMQKLESISHIDNIHLISHLACADDRDHPLNNQQTTCFSSLKHPRIASYSLLNSAGIMTLATHKPERVELVRAGLMLYGVSPLPNQKLESIDLQAVMTLTSEIIAINQVDKDQAIGYSATYVTQKQTKVAVVACGYADGYPREICNAYVLLNGIKAPVIGRVAMDMLTIDVSHIEQVQIGDKVELFGSNLPVEQVANWANTIPYTILTHIAPRVRFDKI